MHRQVIKDKDFISLIGIEKVRLDFWKYQNQKELSRAIEMDKKNKLQAIVELPKFEVYVRKHELLWRKSRNQFNALEKEYIDRTYQELNN